MSDASKSPRSGLAPGVDPVTAGRAKRDRVLAWLYAFRFSTSAVLSDTCKVERSYPAELKRRGFLRSFDTPHLLARHAWILTEDGLAYAQQVAAVSAAYDLNPATVDHRTLRHDLAVQRVVGALRPSFYHPARMMGKDFPATKRPDCFVVLDDPQGPVPAGHHYIETELTPKKDGRELEQALLSGIRSVEEDRCDTVVYVSQSHSLLDHYRHYLINPRGLFRWKYDKETGKWSVQAEGYRELKSDSARLVAQLTAADDAAEASADTPLHDAIAAARNSEAGFPDAPSQYFIWWHVPWLLQGL
jgi:hypothetical protein